MKWKAITLAALVGFAVLVVWFFTERKPSVRLPDGSHLVVERIVFTNRYHYTHFLGPAWQRFLIQKLPLTWRQRFGIKQHSSGGFLMDDIGANSLILVTEQTFGETAPDIQLDRIHVVDEDGSVFEATFDAITMRGIDSAVQGWRFKAFPRRQKRLRCRFIYKNSSGQYGSAAEVLIPNPAPGPHPVWQPEVLPTTRTNQDLRVTLVDFVAGLRHEGDVAEKSQWYWIGRETTRAAFRLEQVGYPNPAWKIQSLTVSDSSGNHWKPGLEEPPIPPPEGMQYAEFIGALWPSESAFRLRIEFSRTNGFSPDELWTIADIRVPATNELLTIGDHHIVNGLDFELVAMGGAGADLGEPFHVLSSQDAVNLAIRISTNVTNIASDQSPASRPDTAELRLTPVKAPDDQGRSIPLSEPLPWRELEHVFALNVPQGAKKLSVTLAVHRSRIVEFTARPSRAGALLK